MIFKLIKLFFGATPPKAFKRLILFILFIAIIFFLTLQVSCGFDKQGNFYFNVKPAANINVDLSK